MEDIMAKQNMNLDQLYKHRFQSLEMNPSTDISQRMQNKIRHDKKMQWLKWISIGVLLSAIALIISLYAFSNHGEQTPTTLQNKQKSSSIAQQNPPLKTLANLSAEKQKLEQNDQSMIHHEEETSFEKPPLKTNLNNEILIAQHHKEELNVARPLPNGNRRIKEEGNKNHSPSNQLIGNIDSRLQTNALYLDPKVSQLPLTSYTPIWKASSLELSPKGNRVSSLKRKSSSAKNLSENISYDKTPSHVSGVFDIHFSPLLWQNNGKSNDIGLVSDWSSSLNYSAQLSYEMGFSFQLHHEQTPLFMQIGLDYQVLKEKIDHRLSHSYEDPELSSWDYDSIFDIQTVVDTFYIIVDSNQFIIDTVFTQDTSLSSIDSSYHRVMSTEEKRKKQVNTYTYLNIPLMLGYEFQTQNKKWSFQVLAGGALAINLSNDGYYYRNHDRFESYSGKVSPSLIWSFQAAANINHQWKKWQFYLQPEFQYQLNESRVIEFAPYRQYQFYKLKAGIRYQLF